MNEFFAQERNTAEISKIGHFSRYGVNRRYKDRLFVMLFGSEEYKENMLSLYNALNGTHYTDPNDITITTIQDVIYIRMKNDVSLLLHDVLNLWEQQSTYNPNMPLRGFLYFGNLYEAYIDKGERGIYSSTLIKIPTPKYVVLYNGTDEQPAREKLRLSDAFKVKEETAAGDFEWTAEMININKGKNPGLLAECPALADYMTLVNSIQDRKNSGLPIEEAVDSAVKECIEKNVLTDFLRKHRAEVRNVCLTEFDEKKFVRTMKEEGYKEGKLETAKAMLKDGVSAEKIALYTGLSASEITALTAQ